MQFDSGIEMVEHQGIAPCIPVWKTGVCLSTPMLVEKLMVPCRSQQLVHQLLAKVESRAGIASAFAALQAAA